jgi:hypothetical protein
MTEYLSSFARSVRPPVVIGLCGGVRVHLVYVSVCLADCMPSVTDLALATGHCDVDEAAGVSEPLLRAALGGLLLLLGLDLSHESASMSFSVIVSQISREVDSGVAVGRRSAYLGCCLLADALRQFERVTYESET